MENSYLNWNLSDIFNGEKDYENAKMELLKLLSSIKSYQGKLCENTNTLLECYNLFEKALELYEKIYSYGMLKYHLDMSNQSSIKLFKEVEKISADFAMATSFIVPEITMQDEEKIREFINDEKLIKYKRALKEILEDKKHVLTKEEESLLANYSEIFSSAENTYDTFTNAELKYGNIVEEDGKEIELTDANYSLFLKSKNQNIRKQAFTLMYDAYKKYINTITELYLTRVKQKVITSKIRKYESSLESAVLNDDSSIKVYENLTSVIDSNLNVNYEFMKLKEQMVNNDKMHLYDIYLNPVEKIQSKTTFDNSKNEVLDALSILGQDYQELLKEAFNNNWVDVYEKTNKRSGAYSLGVYGVHPYVLLNFTGDTRDTSTIAHELGHAMHSYYSNNNQNIIDSNYTIMVAEVASTVNEILLANYQIENEKDKNKKAVLIYEMLEMIRATLFRQTMFAEFEKEIHDKVTKNESLSSEDLCNVYYDLNRKYFGDSVIIDNEIRYEWARIPHFYSCFYVYKYATGISSAIAIASNIIKDVPGYVERYKNMLKLGCSKKSIDLLRLVDVDLETKEPYEKAIAFFKENIEKLRQIFLENNA